jgi:hypothetical protein
MVASHGGVMSYKRLLTAWVVVCSSSDPVISRPNPNVFNQQEIGSPLALLIT